MSGAPERLERSYRRLLACYPAAHRAVYADEMLGVLMTASAPGQRRPRAGEALNLVISGLRARLRVPLRAIGAPAWRDAARAFGYLGSVLLATMYVHQALSVVAGLDRTVLDTPRTATALGVTWAVAAFAAGFGSRIAAVVAAVTASAGAAGQAVAIARAYANEPGALVTSWWRLVLAVVAAASLVVAARRRARPEPPDSAANEPAEPEASARIADRRSRLGRPTKVVVAAVALLVCVAPLIESDALLNPRLGETTWRLTSPMLVPGPASGTGLVSASAMLVLLVTLAIAVLRLRPSIRRRVLLLAAPAAAAALLVALTFGGFLASSPRFSPPVQLIASQWIALAATPVLVLAIGAWLLARYERKLVNGTLLA